LLRAGIWEEEGSHEVSLFTSVYAASEKDGSRNLYPEMAKERPKEIAGYKAIAEKEF
jgi:hypothetical protein